MLTEIALAEDLKIAPEIRLVKVTGIVLFSSIDGLTVLAIVAFGDDSLDGWHVVIVGVNHQGKTLLFLPDNGSFGCGYDFEQLDGLVESVAVVKSAADVRQKHILYQP